MELRGASDSDETIGSMGTAGLRTDLLATARRRFSSSAPSPNAFLTPAFTSAPGAGGSTTSLSIEPSLLHFAQSRMSRLHFCSSSSSSNESPDTHSPCAAVAARKRMQQLFKFRSLSYSSHRGSSQSPMSPVENLQTLPLSARSSPPFSVYKNPVNMEVEEDVLVMDALGESVPLTCRARKPLEILSSSSSSSSANNSHFGANFFKTEICRSWEECGFCRFGSRCQFAHGKEELRGTPGHSKLKPEDILTKEMIGGGFKRDGLYNLEDLKTGRAHLTEGGSTGVRENVWLWHRRLGYPFFGYMQKLSPTLFGGLNKEDFISETCIKAKSHRSTYNSSLSKSTSPFELVHSNIWGPSPIASKSRCRWFVLFIDDCTRVTWLYVLKTKVEVIKVF